MAVIALLMSACLNKNTPSSCYAIFGSPCSSFLMLLVFSIAITALLFPAHSVQCPVSPTLVPLHLFVHL